MSGAEIDEWRKQRWKNGKNQTDRMGKDEDEYEDEYEDGEKMSLSQNTSCR
jgi:hypothetical protein